MSITKDKPHFLHACLLGILAIGFAMFLSSGLAWDLTAIASKTILDIANIDSSYSSSIFTVFISLLNGSNIGFMVLAECSGLVSVAIFSFIFVFTIGLLSGPLLTKITWFIVGICVGLLWNIGRLAFVMGVAYQFGLDAFFWFHYIVGPSIDFIWVVSVWTLAMSRLRYRKAVSL